MQPRRRLVAVVAGRAIALELVEAVERDVEPVAALVLDDRDFERRLADEDRLDAAVDPDAVVEVDDVVARGERAGGRRRRRLAVAARPAEAARAAEDLVVGEDPEASRITNPPSSAPIASVDVEPAAPPSSSSSSSRSSWPSLSQRIRVGRSPASRPRSRSRCRGRPAPAGRTRPGASAGSSPERAAARSRRAAPRHVSGASNRSLPRGHVLAQPPRDLEVMLRLAPGARHFFGVGAGRFLDDRVSEGSRSSSV